MTCHELIAHLGDEIFVKTAHQLNNTGFIDAILPFYTYTLYKVKSGTKVTKPDTSLTVGNIIY